jgi:hypothetical protein
VITCGKNPRKWLISLVENVGVVFETIPHGKWLISRVENVGVVSQTIPHASSTKTVALSDFND